MIVDSSAVLAIILNESDAQRYKIALAAAESRHITSPNWLEVALVIESRADENLRDGFESLFAAFDVTIAPFLPRHAVEARRAWQRFGRGRHPAKLNYGDCMAYAFAKAEGRPLLFKGNDFALTDIEPALKD